MEALFQLWDNKEALMICALWAYLFHCERRNHEEHVKFNDTILEMTKSIGKLEGRTE